MPVRGTWQGPSCSRERRPLWLSPEADSTECGLRWGEGQANTPNGILQHRARPVQLTCSHFPLSLMGVVSKANHHGVSHLCACFTHRVGPLTEVLPFGLLTDAMIGTFLWFLTQRKGKLHKYADFPKDLFFGACTPSSGDKGSEAEKSSGRPASLWEMVNSTGFVARPQWLRVLSLPIPICVILGKITPLSLSFL